MGQSLYFSVTVEVKIPALPGPKRCWMSQCSGYYIIIPNVYHSVLSNLMDRPNHLICPLFPYHTLFSLSTPLYIIVYKKYKKKHRQDPQINGQAISQKEQQNVMGILVNFRSIEFSRSYNAKYHSFCCTMFTIYKRCTLYNTWTNLNLRMKPRQWMT
jgi:hypothetical protein